MLIVIDSSYVLQLRHEMQDRMLSSSVTNQFILHNSEPKVEYIREHG